MENSYMQYIYAIGVIISFVNSAFYFKSKFTDEYASKALPFALGFLFGMMSWLGVLMIWAAMLSDLFSRREG